MGFGSWWVNLGGGGSTLSMGLGVGLSFSLFWWFVGCGFCDQRRARMVVTGLGGVTGFFVGLGMKSSCGATGYTRIAGCWFGFVQDLMGQILER